jgi:Uma2 family endonuclease
MSTLHRVSVTKYHEMIAKGILGEDDPIELIEGYMVAKMPRNPEHDSALSAVQDLVTRMVPSGFTVRGQCAATIQDSEPEPDLVVARGDRTVFRSRHPGPADTRLVVEVSALSLIFDRTDKARVYARARVPVYWVVNVIDKQIEVLTQPGGPDDAAAYAQRDVFAVGTHVPVVLDGNTIGMIAVADVLG